LNFELEKLPGNLIDTKITHVSIHANRTNISIHHAISFSGYAEDLDGDILTFTWKFNDGTPPAVGKQVSHSFHKSGQFNVTLTVKDTDGNELSSFINITVNPDPSDPSNGIVDNGVDSEEKDWISTNFGLVFLILILIVVIILMIGIYIRIQQRKAEEELELQRENERARRRRKREMEFVDKDKRNVEQINLIISELHRTRAGRFGRPRKKKESSEDDKTRGIEESGKKHKSAKTQIKKRKKKK